LIPIDEHCVIQGELAYVTLSPIHEVGRG
jgi:hypothetical protein